MASIHPGGAVAEVVAVHRPVYDGLSVFSEAGTDLNSPRPYGYSGLGAIALIEAEDCSL